MYLMSAPAMKARSPAPVRTTNACVDVAGKLGQAVAKRCKRLDIEAFRASGRSTVTIATGPSCRTSIS